MRRTVKALAGICVLAGAMFITAGVAGAQLDPTPEECDNYLVACDGQEITFTHPASVHAGDVMDIEGQVTNIEDKAAIADETATITMADEELGTAAIATDGTFAGEFTVPSALEPGDYTISASSGGISTDSTITVVSDDTEVDDDDTSSDDDDDDALARTGFDAAPMVTLGAAVLVLGAAALYGSKRRRLT